MAEQTTRTPAQKRTTAAKRTTKATNRSTAAKKGVATKATQATQANTKRTATKVDAKATAAERNLKAEAKSVEREADTLVAKVGEVAEKVVLTSVGAALIARDEVVDTVTDVRSTYSTRAKAEKRVQVNLRKAERRGTTARNQLEREVKKTRNKVERELRTRRTQAERTIRRNAEGVETQTQGLGKSVTAQVELVTARVENVVQSGVTAGAKTAAKVTERVSAIA